MCAAVTWVRTGPRLDRIGRLLGRDCSTPARALEIQLALRLQTLAGVVDGGS
jgi:hypothetical protein